MVDKEARKADQQKLIDEARAAIAESNRLSLLAREAIEKSRQLMAQLHAIDRRSVERRVELPANQRLIVGADNLSTRSAKEQVDCLAQDQRGPNGSRVIPDRNYST